MSFTTRPITAKLLVTRAMRDLRKQGYWAIQGFADCALGCGGCASEKTTARLNAMEVRRVAWWGIQSHRASFTGQHLLHPLYVHWEGDAEAVIQAFRDQGFTVEWPGTTSDSIVVLPIADRPHAWRPSTQTSAAVCTVCGAGFRHPLHV